MLGRDYEGQNCSVARALEVVGERWTLLLVRDAFLGRRRFEEFHESLGVARNVLADRLAKLVEHGIFERVRYQERPERYEYQLTDKGRDLRVPLLALMQWGDQYLSPEPPRLARRLSDHAPVGVAIVAPDGSRVDPTEVETVAVQARRHRPNPGA